MKKIFFIICSLIGIYISAQAMEDCKTLILNDIKRINQDGPSFAELFLKALNHSKALEKESSARLEEIKFILRETITTEEPKKELYETTDKSNFSEAQLLTFRHLAVMRKSIAEKRILFARNTLMLIEGQQTERAIKQSVQHQRAFINRAPTLVKTP